MFMMNKTPNHSGIKAQRLDHRDKYGRADHDDSCRVQDAPQDEKDGLNGEQDDVAPAGNGEEEVLHQLMGSGPGVHRGEAIGADEDPDDHGGEGRGLVAGLLHQRPGQLAVNGRGDQRPENAQGGGLRRRTDPPVDGAQDHDDDGHWQSHGFQRDQLFMPGGPLLLGQGGPKVRLEEAADADVKNKDEGQKKARKNTAGKQPADRLPGERGVEDHGHTGGDENSQRPSSGDAPHGHDLVVFSFEHGWKGDDAHGNRRRGADA